MKGVTMSIAFPATSTGPSLAQVTSIDKEVRGQIDTSLPSTAPGVTILSTDVLADLPARMATIVKAYAAHDAMTYDASRVMDALVPTMQSVVNQRPDLADAKFDFQTDNGHLKVVSSTMSAKDRAWLEDQLNANHALVSATQSFHEHAVEGYQLAASLDDSPSTTIDTAAISAAADNKFSFMDIFQRLGQASSAVLDQGGSYYTADGMAIDFDLVPNNASSFLRFAKRPPARWK
jgi:alpha-beta hydrolase superfamily lysophospholipase